MHFFHLSNVLKVYKKLCLKFAAKIPRKKSEVLPPKGGFFIKVQKWLSDAREADFDVFSK